MPQMSSTFWIGAVIATAIIGDTVFALDPPAIEAVPMVVDSKITGVTIYRGRASVTRSATLQLQAGLFELHFSNLPEAVQPQTLQARTGGVLKVLGVDYLQEAAANVATSPKVAELDTAIEKLQQDLKKLAEQRDLLKAQEDFINAVSVRATTDASKEGGTDKLDLDAVKRQLAFITDERTRLLNTRRELDKQQKDLEKELQIAQARRAALAGAASVSRSAIVSAVAAQAGSGTIDLTYLVNNASWEPAYNIRASMDGSTAQVEYDAILTQRTGEDWDNVILTLSTAQPMVAANPPELLPWFVDIQRPVEAAKSAGRRTASEMPPAAAPADRADAEFRAKYADAGSVDKFAALNGLAADAEVAGTGPSVTFQLPRQVTVRTNSQKQQRTRIATIDSQPKFVYVAVPMLTDAVYIRGELTNSSAYQLLPGKASIFVGQDCIGPTTLPSVAPNGDFKVFFGIDPAVKTSRQLITKNTENTGLLSGGRRTSYEYRLSIDNGAGKPITVELWDRYPVSRAEEIQIEVVDLSAPLATDAKYIAEQKPQGMMKWNLNVPAGATDKSAYVVKYGLRVNRAKDVQMTPLPE